MSTRGGYLGLKPEQPLLLYWILRQAAWALGFGHPLFAWNLGGGAPEAGALRPAIPGLNCKCFGVPLCWAALPIADFWPSAFPASMQMTEVSFPDCYCVVLRDEMSESKPSIVKASSVWENIRLHVLSLLPELENRHLGTSATSEFPFIARKHSLRKRRLAKSLEINSFSPPNSRKETNADHQPNWIKLQHRRKWTEWRQRILRQSHWQWNRGSDTTGICVATDCHSSSGFVFRDTFRKRSRSFRYYCNKKPAISNQLLYCPTGNCGHFSGTHFTLSHCVVSQQRVTQQFLHLPFAVHNSIGGFSSFSALSSVPDVWPPTSAYVPPTLPAKNKYA